MGSEVFIDILVKCFEFVGLTPIKHSPIRLEVLDAYGNIRVGEVYFINNSLNGMRIGFKEGLKWQINHC